MLTDEQFQQCVEAAQKRSTVTSKWFRFLGDEAYRLGVAAERKRCERIAWEYARGLRKPSGLSMQQGDDIAATIERGEDA